MHSLRLAALATALVATLLNAKVPPAHATLIRVPMASSERGHFPRSFEALRQRVLSLGYSVIYEYAPEFDPYFNAGGGAEYGNITVTVQRATELSLGWVAFDNDASAAAYEAELLASATYSNTAFRRRGRIVIVANLYAYPPTSDQAAELLDQVLGG